MSDRTPTPEVIDRTDEQGSTTEHVLREKGRTLCGLSVEDSQQQQPSGSWRCGRCLAILDQKSPEARAASLTPEERSCRALCDCRNEGRSRGTAYHASRCLYMQSIRDANVAAEIRAAIAAERARCKRVAWEYARGIRKSDFTCTIADQIALAIEAGDE